MLAEVPFSFFLIQNNGLKPFSERAFLLDIYTSVFSRYSYPNSSQKIQVHKNNSIDAVVEVGLFLDLLINFCELSQSYTSQVL